MEILAIFGDLGSWIVPPTAFHVCVCVCACAWCVVAFSWSSVSCVVFLFIFVHFFLFLFGPFLFVFSSPPREPPTIYVCIS